MIVLRDVNKINVDVVVDGRKDLVEKI